MATGDKAGESEVMLRLSAPIGKPVVEHRLHTFPKIVRHKRGIDTGVCLPIPIEVPCVDSASKDFVHRGPWDGIVDLAENHPFDLNQLSDFGQRILSGAIPLEHSD